MRYYVEYTKFLSDEVSQSENFYTDILDATAAVRTFNALPIVERGGRFAHVKGVKA